MLDHTCQMILIAFIMGNKGGIGGERGVSGERGVRGALVKVPLYYIMSNVPGVFIR